MWASGRLEQSSVDRVLLMLAARSSTGTLTIQQEDVIAVRFRRGEITGADALKESLTHGLGRILVAAGHLNRDQVAALETADLGGSVVDHLLAQGLVPPQTLAGCVRQHTYLLVLRLLGWKTGEYAFYEGEVPLMPELRPLSVEELLVRASEEDPRLLGVAVAPLGEEVLRPMLGRRAVRVLSWEQEAGLTASGEGADEEELWLTSFEDALLRSLDGLTPSIEFKERLGVDEFRLRFALHRLHRAGLVEVARAAPRRAAASLALGAAEAEAGLAPAEDREHVPEPTQVALEAPAPESAESLAARQREQAAQLGDLSRAFSYTLAAGLAVIVLALVLGTGSATRLHQPFPWQEAGRQRVESLRVASIHHDLTGKLEIYHLLYGTFPLDLRPLVDTGLADARELEDAGGRTVTFEGLEGGFVLGIAGEGGESLAGPRSRFSVAGDFLLDPDFPQVEGQQRGVPVQILD